MSYRSRVYGTHVYSARDNDDYDYDDDYDCDYEDDEETLSYRDTPWLVDDDSIYDEDDEDSYHSSWDGNEWDDCLDDENCVGFDDGCEADFDDCCDDHWDNDYHYDSGYDGDGDW